MHIAVLISGADYGSVEVLSHAYEFAESWMLGYELQAWEFQNYTMERIYALAQEQRQDISVYTLYYILEDAPAGSPLREFFLDFWATNCLTWPGDHYAVYKFRSLLLDHEDAATCLIRAIISPADNRSIRSEAHYMIKQASKP